MRWHAEAIVDDPVKDHHTIGVHVAFSDDTKAVLEAHDPEHPHTAVSSGETTSTRGL